MVDADSSAEFLRRAVAEAARYGEDPTVFLRELGQNARDANATRIQVGLRVEAGRAWLVFSDDGRGMSLEHARAYLFRLYASSKEADAASAGRFGVGFWSVLRWSPARIEVHSRSRDQAWGVGLAGDLRSWERLACRRKSQGTSIVLVRAGIAGDGEALRDEIHRGLVRYLAHLRTAGLRPKPLPVRFDGRRIERPFQLAGPGALQFSEGPLEGVVGFGPRPSYKLFARGLPVSEGAFLDELEGQPGQAQKVEREGVAPVYLLNGNNLEVVLSRQTVVRDRALRELVRVARTRFEELVARTIDGAVSQSLGQRLLGLTAKLARAFGRAPTWLRITGIVVALVLLGAAIGLTAAWLGHKNSNGQLESGLKSKTMRADSTPTPAPNDRPRATPRSLARRAPGAPTLGVRPEKPRFFGARGAGTAPLKTPVHRPGDWAGVRTGTVVADAGDAGWAFRYRPEIDLMFRRSLLTRYDREFGFQAALEKGPWRRPVRMRRDRTEQVEIELRLDGAGGWYILPIPTGYAAVRGSCRFRDRGLLLQANPQGLVRVKVPSGVPGDLRYRVAPAPDPGAELIATMISPPRRLPETIERRLEVILALPEDERVAASARLVQELLAYDRSPATAGLYGQRLGQGRDWAAEVVDIGAGDCDVINGLAVLVLHRLGVPARLVAGMVGRRGSGLAGWHAWIEIIREGRLEVLDVSQGAQGLARATSPTPAAAPGPAPGRSASLPAPAGSPSAAGDPRPAWADRLQTAGLGLLAFALAMIALFAFYALGRRGQLAVSSDDEQRRELLAGMAADALRRPKAWKDVQGIWHRGFLPCVGKKTISLARLVKLSRAERAFVGKSGGELVGEALRSGLVVLAADDPHFGPLYSRTANLRDLDELARNKPLAKPRGIPGRLLVDLERLLARHGGRIACRAVRADGSGRPFWDVDLRPIRPRRRSGWPRRFVAVDLEHPWWASVAGLYRSDPALAVCVAMDRLATGAALLAERSGPLRRAVARWALRQKGAGG